MRYDLLEPRGAATGADGSEIPPLTDHLIFRLPRAQDLIDTKGRTGADGVVATVALLTGQPESFIRRLGLVDFNAVDDILTGFFSGPQQAGAKRAAAFLQAAGISAPTGDTSPLS